MGNLVTSMVALRFTNLLITRLLRRFSPIFYLNCERVLFVYILKQKRKKVPGLHEKISWINLALMSVCLFVCLFVCLYPINVKTAEPIGPKFFVGSRVIPGKVYE